MNAAAVHLRAQLYTCIREFFATRKMIEVETPILSQAGNTDPNIESFVTTFEGHADAGERARYLRNSPEFPLKRLLAAGLGDCYELGRVFRNGESGRRHNPEFTMLEWYRRGLDHRQLAEEVIDLLLAATALAGTRPSVQRVSYAELFRQMLDIDPHRDPLPVLQQPLRDYSIDPQGLTREDWLDLLLTHCVQPGFARDTITMVYDFPARQCALARVREGDPPLAERFEVFLGPHELANGYHELNDASEQRARFRHDNAVRRERGQTELPLDENLLAILDALPDCAGVALGIDRLLMCLLDSEAIADVLTLPFAEA